uniref:Uncharacterized protein n=1 Tax=Oryza punctata TaxID=4537 RepID=A0A0E0LIP5_ORYPU
MACSLPSSVISNAALRAFLASCCKPLPPTLLPPPPPPATTVVTEGVVPKRSKRIAGQLAISGPCHTVTCVQCNLMRKLGLTPKEGKDVGFTRMNARRPFHILVIDGFMCEITALASFHPRSDASGNSTATSSSPHPCLAPARAATGKAGQLQGRRWQGSSPPARGRSDRGADEEAAGLGADV